MSLKRMKADDLISFFIEEAEHRVINDKHTKYAESALAVHRKKPKKDKFHKGKTSEKPRLSITCENCNQDGHSKEDCWLKGGGKEGKGPRNQRLKREKKPESTAVSESLDDALFAFTCTSDYADLPKALQILKSHLGACIDSGASCHYCPDQNY